MKVATIITVYKKEKLPFFKEAINSIVNQDYGFENICIYLGIDGILSDDMEHYISSKKERFYKIVRNPSNAGLTYTLNRLIGVLEDEKYVFRMDSDDISKPYRFRKQVDFMEQNSNIEITGGAIEELDGKEIRMVRTYPKTTEEAKKYIPKASIFAHPAVCFRKTFFEKGFRYNEKYRFSQDLALWFDALSKNIEIHNTEEILLTFRTSLGLQKRRGSKKKSLNEFQIYYKGILSLYGYNWRVVYPIIRLLMRLLIPAVYMKKIYSSRIRKGL